MAKRRPYEILAANVKRLAHLRGSSLESVANAAGITLERLEAIFTGEFDPNIELVDRIANAVGVSASELITEPEFN